MRKGNLLNLNLNTLLNNEMLIIRRQIRSRVDMQNFVAGSFLFCSQVDHQLFSKEGSTHGGPPGCFSSRMDVSNKILMLPWKLQQ